MGSAPEPKFLYRKKNIAVHINPYSYHFVFTGGNTTEDLEMTVALVCFVIVFSDVK